MEDRVRDCFYRPWMKMDDEIRNPIKNQIKINELQLDLRLKAAFLRTQWLDNHIINDNVKFE